MTRRMKLIAGLAALACVATAAGFALFAHKGPQAELAGYDRIDLRSPHRAYPVAASVWYPLGSKTYLARIGDNPVFRGTLAYVGAGIAEGRYPLVLFSHGSGGNMDAMSWLLSDLANRGAMVLAVNHQGSTSGDSSPRRSLRLDERAQDLSAALDALLADPSFAGHVDRDRIYSVGFSLGGATALNLAGLQWDSAAYQAYCTGFGQDNADCSFFAKGGIDFANIPAGFSADMRDARVRKAVAIDPAFGFVASVASAAAMDLPVLLLNLGDADRLAAADVSDRGNGLAGKLPQARYEVIAPASHFTFLADCKRLAPMLLKSEGEDPICTDPSGTDRAQVHQKAAELIANFLSL